MNVNDSVMLKLENRNFYFFRCSLFRIKGCPPFGRIDKSSDLFQITHKHNYNVESEKIFLSNQIRVRLRLRVESIDKHLMNVVEILLVQP